MPGIQFPKPSEMINMFHPPNFDEQESSFKKMEQFDSNTISKSNKSEGRKESASASKGN